MFSSSSDANGCHLAEAKDTLLNVLSLHGCDFVTIGFVRYGVVPSFSRSKLTAPLSRKAFGHGRHVDFTRLQTHCRCCLRTFSPPIPLIVPWRSLRGRSNGPIWVFTPLFYVTQYVSGVLNCKENGNVSKGLA